MVPLLIVSGAVILISAFCSLCEAVIYSIPATHVARLREEGHRSGEILEALRENIDRPITAILTVNTVANTAGAAVAGSLATSALGEGNIVLFSVALTVAILLFSEIIPKTLGVVYSRVLGPWLARPLAAMVLLMTPLVAIIGFLTRLIASDEVEGVSQEEIASMARLGSRSGAIDAGEAAVIQNILALHDRTAKQIMTPRMVAFTLQQSIGSEEACGHERLMVHSRIPVWSTQPDDIVGMVFRRDVLACETDTPLTQLLRPVDFVGEAEPVDQVLDRMLERKRHILVVLDEFGGFAGVVTLEDVLEEILGEEIMDEFDQVEDLRQLALDRRTAALDRMKTLPPPEPT